MPSKKPKSERKVQKLAPDECDIPCTLVPSEDPLSEIDLISLDEPEAVDLGDFRSVWQHLASYSHQKNSSGILEGMEPPASRRQFIQKSSLANRCIPDQTSSEKETAPELPTTPNDAGRHTKSDARKAKRSKPKTKPKPSESSPEEDGEEESSWYSSDETKRRIYESPRRRSFLYVPPSFSSPASSPRLRPVLPPAPSAARRRRDLIQKLVARYPDQVNRILLAQSSASPDYSSVSTLATLQSQDIHIFIDNSNILIGFFDTYKSKHNITDPFFRAPKFDFHAFTTILERGRSVSRKILVGSNPLTQPVALAQRLGYEVSILERVIDQSKRLSTSSAYASDSATRTPQREKKKEQAVDEILHLKILECLLDVDKPATIVLATGDAAPAEFSPEGGFFKCIQRALNRGWNVELVCWRKSMSRLWRDKMFRVEWRDTFSVVELDDFVDELVLE